MLLTLLSLCSELFTVCVRRFLKYSSSLNCVRVCKIAIQYLNQECTPGDSTIASGFAYLRKFKDELQLIRYEAGGYSGQNACRYHIHLANPFKPSVLFMGHRQTVKNQTKDRRTRRLVRFCTVCLQNVHLKFE